MKAAETKLLLQLAAKLRALSEDMLESESSLLDRSLPLHKNHRRSARNLAHYLALRRHDLREVQASLAGIGLSSLGRTEGHVLSAIQNVYHAVSSLLGEADQSLCDEAPVKMCEGAALLDANTRTLLGCTPSGRKVRIMVTMSTDASTDYALVRDLVQSGMDCMRINCAHDNPEVWLGMIRNLQKARKETGRSCSIEMDLAGPKLRTGPLEPGPAVIRCRPARDEFGRVVRPAKIWLTPLEKSEIAPAGTAATLQLEGEFLSKLRRGDTIRFRDARNAHRSLRVVKVEDQSCLAETRRTVYFIPGLELHAIHGKKADHAEAEHWKGRVGPIPPRMQRLLLKPGETLILFRSAEPGRPAQRNKKGYIVSHAQIGISLPNFLEHAKAGEQIWFDDGKIGGVIRSVNTHNVHVEITQARSEGERLGEGKGINLPNTRIDMPALTVEDVENLKFLVEHADLVGYSFVRTESDVQQLLAHLHEFHGDALGIVLKIETRQAFENLPGLILAAMAVPAVGVMIARGDLAVECGYQRLAEVQEEILWISEAAHVPVIWATQVLESLSRNGIPSRSEITDAAMGERAECVMLNKGPYVVQAVSALDDILRRMQSHQEKKRSMLRKLQIASSFEGTNNHTVPMTG